MNTSFNFQCSLQIFYACEVHVPVTVNLGMTAQLAAAMQRVYCIGKPAKAKKAALLPSSEGACPPKAGFSPASPAGEKGIL